MDASDTVCERCGAKMPATATAFLHEGQVICRDCHDELRPVCPNCERELPSRPETTRACPLCGWAIHVAREQDLYDTALLSKQQIDRVAEFRKKLGLLRRFGATEGGYVRVKAQLAQQTGQQPDDVAIMRRLFYEAARNAGNNEDRAAIAYAEARYLFENGLDYFHVLKRAHKNQLEAMQQQGIDGVTIEGPVDRCAYCRKRAGAPLAVVSELRDPELPNPDCPNRTVQTRVWIQGELTEVGVSKGAYCEAKYVPYAKA
jgi:hypothetical protein